ncbi:CocE/NonD family hydrolase [Loktanella sp. R86503]|uniref:CocE/NonD family hydrolase n=1 Tax=Loktanella sp. R86503 TaxID=3093847 RepID=UPI0036DAA6D5
MTLRRVMAGCLVCAAVAGLGLSQLDRLREVRGQLGFQAKRLALGITLDSNIMIPMPDGITLATDLYRPRASDTDLPTILIRLPYGKTTYGEALRWVRTWVPRGYAVAVQDIRGRFGSGGTFTPYADTVSDGAATLDWIAAQDWSNGRVAMGGCSALGEVQLMQAKAGAPHLRALIAEGAGGAIGTGGASRAYFAFFEGGIPNLAAAYGWFSANGGKTGDHMHGVPIDAAEVIGQLPTGTLVSRNRSDPTDYDNFLRNFDNTAYWDALGYLKSDDSFDTPALHINTWHDIGVRGTFEAAALMRKRAVTDAARNHQHVIIGPGLHCDLQAAFAAGGVGDLAVAPDSALDLDAIYASWLNHWLLDGPLPRLPQYTYFVNGADRWDSSDVWPPADVTMQTWYLEPGKMTQNIPKAAGSADFTYDPMDPTPSIGGPICCTGGLNLPAGPLDQRPNAARHDILGFTSGPLSDPLTLAGNITAEIVISTDVPDTDLVAVLMDIAPDGTMLAIQQGALRLRYRDGFDDPAPLLTPDDLVTATIAFPPIAYRVAEGHRLGLHISSASFPRLERHMNGPGLNAQSDTPRLAHTTVWFGPASGSALMLPVQPAH